jgi:hypothetical protein
MADRQLHQITLALALALCDSGFDRIWLRLCLTRMAGRDEQNILSAKLMYAIAICLPGKAKFSFSTAKPAYILSVRDFFIT